jgi:hypothetical protein
MHTILTTNPLLVLSASSWLYFTNPTNWSICLEIVHLKRNIQRILFVSQRNFLYDNLSPAPIF